MKLLIVFCILFGTSFAELTSNPKYCVNNIHEACSSINPSIVLEEVARNVTLCASAFGAFPQLSEKTQALIASHLQSSMQYMLLANHFAEWDVDRKGFQKVFDTLSDDAFNDAVTTLQYMVKRGGRLYNLTVPMPEAERYDMGELEAMSKALDIEKSRVSKMLSLAHAVTHSDVASSQHADAALAHFLADRVSDNHVDRVKTLANHVNTLSQAISQALTKNRDPSFVLHIYDTQFL